jgi:hypothetical protein
VSLLLILVVRPQKAEAAIAITATELELLACLGAEPTLAEPDKPWCYTDSMYEVTLDDLRVTLTIHPSYHDVEFVAARAGQPLYELKAIGVQDVRVLDFPGCDVFEIWLSKQEWLRVQLRPRFSIKHGFEKLPPWTGVADIPPG